MFENSSFPTKTETEKEFQNGFVSMLGNVKAVVTGISTAIALVILLISANTMAMAARERVTEIAVLRTLGFGKPLILTLILAESLLLSATGAVVGLGLFRLAFPVLKEGLLSSPMAGFAAGMQLFPEVLLTGDRHHAPRRPRRRDRPGHPLRPALHPRRPPAGRVGEDSLMLGIPLKYNVRNLFVRKVTTTLTVLGIALVVAVFLCVMALGEGLTRVFTASGSEKNVLVLRQNSQSELQSGIGRDQARS